MFVTVILSIFLINEAIKKFLDPKIGIKISDERQGVIQIPFPAISICPEVLFDENIFESFQDEEQQLFRQISDF
jgi:Amiloride-sensitive sodium channel